MARGRRTVSRMEKSVQSGLIALSGTTSTSVQAFQLDGGEVEAQVKRIMFSAAEIAAGKSTEFKIGLFQFAPSATDFNQDETIVISGVIGNQFRHNETITMRVPKDWYIGLLLGNLDPSKATETVWSLQMNYKVLN